MNQFTLGQPPVSLRAVIESDLPILYEHQLDTEATEMADFPSRDHDAFMAQWRKILADDRLLAMTILSGDDSPVTPSGSLGSACSLMAGNIGAFDQDGMRLVGYWLGREFWGKHIASWALAQFVTHVKERPLHATVVAHNIASIRVLEKCGFILKGEHEGEVIMVLSGEFEPLHTAHAFVRETILALTVEQFLAPINEGWSPRDVVAHLVGWNRYMILACKDIMRGDPPGYYVEHNINYRDINAGFVQQYDSRDRDVMLGELEKSLEQLQKFVAGLPAGDLDKDYGVTHYRGGSATITRTLQSLASDYEEHAGEIRLTFS